MRALVVAYYFPPIGGGGVNRTLKLVRALDAAGHAVAVLTVDGAAWTRDRSLESQVPRRVRVVRLPNPDWGRVAARRGARGGAAAPGGGRLRRWLVPDLHVGWSALAGHAAALWAFARAADVVYTTAPPYSAHAAGLVAHTLGLPWLADFRDAWIDCPTRQDLPRWRVRLESRLEAAVLRRADRVLFASEAARRRALARTPGLAARSETVLTGFDAADFAAAGVPPTDRLELVHAGSVLTNHMGACFDALLAGLCRWRSAHAAAAPGVALRLCLVGAEPALAARIEAAGLGDLVGIEPALPKAALGARLKRAHACVALTASLRFGADPVPGKTFDAVGADRPLLAVSPPGALARLVEDEGLGAVVAPDDPQAIAATLEGWRRRVAAGAPLPGPRPAGRRALDGARAMERMVGLLEALGSGGVEEKACPSPSAW